MITILLIEDNKEIRENTVELLELYHYKVISAENGFLGLEAIMKTIPDIIISDIMMPEMNGYEVLKAIKENSSTSNIPFVFFTAKSESMDLEKGIKLGADEYLIKPFEEEELLNVIQRLLEKKKIQQ